MEKVIQQKGLQVQPTNLRGRQFFQTEQNPLGKAGTAAVYDTISAPALRTKRHPCCIHTGFTANVASPTITVINAGRYPSNRPLHNKLERKNSRLWKFSKFLAKYAPLKTALTPDSSARRTLWTTANYLVELDILKNKA